MTPYLTEIENLSTHELKWCPNPGIGYHETGTPLTYREKMCDCLLAAWYSRAQKNEQGEWLWDVATPAIGSHQCAHKMPPTRYAARRIKFKDGTVIDL